jgi:NAD+ kinase
MGASGDAPTATKKLAFLSSGTPEAEEARLRLVEKYGDAPPEEADCIVALGARCTITWIRPSRSMA